MSEHSCAIPLHDSHVFAEWGRRDARATTCPGAADHVLRFTFHARPGTFSRNSCSHTSASESLGARQSPRGESEPPEPTFGPLGMAERLNWLILKKRKRNTSSHFLIVGRSYSMRLSVGRRSGQSPRLLLP